MEAKEVTDEALEPLNPTSSTSAPSESETLAAAASRFEVEKVPSDILLEDSSPPKQRFVLEVLDSTDPIQPHEFIITVSDESDSAKANGMYLSFFFIFSLACKFFSFMFFSKQVCRKT